MLAGPDGKVVFGMVKVGEKGQIVIPKKARDKFKIRPGDSLMLVGDEKSGLALLTSDSLKTFFLEMLKDEGDANECD